MITDITYYKIAKICALIPMVLGISVFTLWLLMRADWLMLAGVLVILFGVLLSFVGMVALFLAKIHAVRNNKPYKRACLRHGFLLLINFPLALGIVVCADYIARQYHVTIVNNYAESVDITFTDPQGYTYHMEYISANSQIRENFYFQGEGSVSYHIKSKTLDRSGIVIGYISSGMSGDAEIEIQSDGAVLVNE